MRDEKLKAVVARSTFPSQNAQSTPGSDPLLSDVEKVHARSKFQSQMYKAHHSRTTFGSCDVEKVHAVVARSTCVSKKAKNTSASERF